MGALDAEWTKNRDEIDRIIRALSDASADVKGVPENLDSIAPREDIEAINPYATKLYKLFCAGSEAAKKMMIQKEVQKNFNDEAYEAHKNYEYGRGERDVL